MLSSHTILKSILHEQGFDVDSPASKRMIKQLLDIDEVQYCVNRAANEVSKALNPHNTLFAKRSALAKLKCKKNQLKADVKMPPIELKMRVPNLTVGKPFHEKIVFLDDIPGFFELCNASGYEEIDGLRINFTEFSIEGLVTTAGDYNLLLYAFQMLASGERRRIKASLKITVNPDPKSLWKTLPSDMSARFHKPDTHFEALENNNVLLLGASVRGRSHAHKGIHRDDDFKLMCSPASQWNVLCVADGAGSCKYSRRGAEVAAARATQTLAEALNGHYGHVLEKAYSEYQHDSCDLNRTQLQEAYRHTIVKAVYEAARCIQDEVDEKKGDRFKDFSTTLLLAAHKPSDEGHLVLSFWVGDGAVAIYRQGQSVDVQGNPDTGEFAGQTRFLDKKMFEDRSVYQRVVLKKVDNFTALILATDGITDPWFETEKEMAEVNKWDVLWDEIKPMMSQTNRSQGAKDLMEWMSFWSPGNHDDRSMVVCCLKE